MAKNAKIERSQKAFLKAMKAKFAEDPTKPVVGCKYKSQVTANYHVTLLPEGD